MVELAIDIGTSKTAIYEKNIGLVLSEPSVVAISKGKNAGLKCAGSEAKKLIGKSLSNTKISFPVFEGLITSPHSASLMLEHFLNKVTPNRLLKPKVKAIITTPCGITAEDKRLFESVAVDSGVKEVIIVESPYTLALHLNLTAPALIIDIGGGKTDIAVFSEEGIIAGCSLGIGGNNLDTGLIDFLVDEYKFKVGLLTAEKIKIQIGSLHKDDISAITVNGKNVANGIPCSMEITAKGIFYTIKYYYEKIAEVIRELLNDLDQSILDEIKKTGIYLTGGASLTTGLKEFLKDYLKIRINALDDPYYATVKGAVKLLNDKSLLRKILEK